MWSGLGAVLWSGVYTGAGYLLGQWALDVLGPRIAAIQSRFVWGLALVVGSFVVMKIYRFIRQPQGDLGRRMSHAFSESFRQGDTRVVAIGTDCPGLTGALLRDAFGALKENDLVLGPARDGGYFRIGLSRPATDLFKGIPWSTERVLESTLGVAHRLGMSTRLLETLADVDRPEDLIELASQRSRPATPEDTVSVVIPTLDEASNVAGAVVPLLSARNVEVVVVDGGSTDGTPEIVRRLGVEVVTSAPGRARQMNAGAAVVRGDTLLFLHADTRLPEGFEVQVRETLRRPGVVAGAFALRIHGPGPGLRAVERLANWRSRRLQMPYGDQAIFLPRRVLRQLGGFPDLPIMEDFELVRRLKRLGRIETVLPPAETSSRRWVERGTIKTTMLNQLMIAGYLLGVAPARLARLYRRQGHRGSSCDAALRATRGLGGDGCNGRAWQADYPSSVAAEPGDGPGADGDTARGCARQLRDSHRPLARLIGAEGKYEDERKETTSSG